MAPYPFQKSISREGEIREKIRAQHRFQNTSIRQQRTSQMVRRSPTASESRIYVLPQRCENISSFQTRGMAVGYNDIVVIDLKMISW